MWKTLKFMSALTFVAACFVALPQVFAGSLDWKTFTSEKGGFTIMMPGHPSYTTKIDHSSVGKIVENLYSYHSDSINLAAEYSDLPGIAIVFGGRKKIYKKSIESFLEHVGGKEMFTEEVDMYGKTSKELVYKTSTHVGKVRFFLAGKRLYVLQASVPIAETNKGAMDYYLRSFRLTSS
jgi:hypothetical protein